MYRFSPHSTWAIALILAGFTVPQLIIARAQAATLGKDVKWLKAARYDGQQLWRAQERNVGRFLRGDGVKA